MAQEAVSRNFKYEVCERVGLFRVFDKSEHEIVLGENDKYLDFRAPPILDQQNNALIVSTIVKIHNWLGSLYFPPVKPIHKLIVPTMMKRMGRQLPKDIH